MSGTFEEFLELHYADNAFLLIGEVLAASKTLPLILRWNQHYFSVLSQERKLTSPGFPDEVS